MRNGISTQFVMTQTIEIKKTPRRSHAKQPHLVSLVTLGADGRVPVLLDLSRTTFPRQQGQRVACVTQSPRWGHLGVGTWGGRSPACLPGLVHCSSFVSVSVFVFLFLFGEETRSIVLGTERPHTPWAGPRCRHLFPKSPREGERRYDFPRLPERHKLCVKLRGDLTKCHTPRHLTLSGLVSLPWDNIGFHTEHVDKRKRIPHS